MTCSNLWATHRSVKNDKRRFSSRIASDEITTHEYMALTFAKCITIMIVELVVTSGITSSLD
jgi:hypothetical protein